jgi:hypothetical protein
MFKRIQVACQKLLEPLHRLSEALAQSVAARQRQMVLDANEAERLDRIRNPSKYVGK